MCGDGQTYSDQAADVYSSALDAPTADEKARLMRRAIQLNWLAVAEQYEYLAKIGGRIWAGA